MSQEDESISKMLRVLEPQKETVISVTLTKVCGSLK